MMKQNASSQECENNHTYTGNPAGNITPVSGCRDEKETPQFEENKRITLTDREKCGGYPPHEAFSECFMMVYCSAELQKLQFLETEMLRAFVRICEQLNLRYYVLGGTLLGAVRHGGFIPWDDDIDVGMPREDYEVFLKEAAPLLPPHLFLQNYRTDPEYCLNITKIRDVRTTFIESATRKQNICHGIFIDVFPLDHYPGTLWAECWYKIKRKILSVRIGKAFLWDKTPNPIKELLKKPLDLIWPDVKQAVEEREKLFRSFPSSGRIANYCGQWGQKEIVPADWYAEGCDLSFEGMTVKGPKEYEKWLTQVYGDYMQLPPEEKRVSHHGTVAIDPDRSYTEFMNNNSGVE